MDTVYTCWSLLRDASKRDARRLFLPTPRLNSLGASPFVPDLKVRMIKDFDDRTKKFFE